MSSSNSNSSSKRARHEVGDNERDDNSNHNAVSSSTNNDDDVVQRRPGKRARYYRPRQQQRLLPPVDNIFYQELVLNRKEDFSLLNQRFKEECRKRIPADGDRALTQLLCANYIRRASEIDLRSSTLAGSIYLCGSNDTDQLGLDVEDDQIGLTKFPFLGLQDHIRQVSAGGLHNVALSLTNKVYTWGCDDEGCLGREVAKRSDGKIRPGIVKGFTTTTTGANGSDEEEEAHIVQVVAGETHTLALSADGKVWSWGMLRDASQDKFHVRPAPDTTIFGPYGQPVRLDDMPGPVIALFTGSSCSFSVAMLADRSICTWGFGNNGELARTADMTQPGPDGNFDLSPEGFYRTLPDGDGSSAVDPAIIREHFLKPKPPRWAGLVPFCKKIVLDVACGAFHLVVTAQNAADDPNAVVPYAYSSGHNNYGQLGLGDTKNRHELTRIDSIPGVCQVAAGQHFSLALSACNQHLWSFGRSDYGCLGVGKLEPPHEEFCPNPLPVKFPQPVVLRQITCGDTHALAITNEHAVYTWGHNTCRATGHPVVKLTAIEDFDVLRPTQLAMTSSTSSSSGQIGRQPGMPLYVSGGGQHSIFLVEEDDDDDADLA